MKNSIFKTVFMAMLAMITITSTGCSIPGIGDPTSMPEKTNVSIIISPTANEPIPNISLAQDIIYEASYSYAFRNVIVDDGMPFEAVNGDLTHAEHDEHLSESNKKLDAQAYTKKFIESANETAAVSPEKDTVKALKMAANSLNGLDGKKTIVLVDNGISTTGSVAFETFNGFNAQESLKNVDESTLPNLKGINVIWFDFGSTLQPQQSLSSNDMVELQKFWTGYLEKAGASDVIIKNAISTNNEPTINDLPPVSTVEVSTEKQWIVTKDVTDVNNEVENASDDKKNGIVSTALDDGVKIDETMLYFEPESSTIANKEAAVELLKPTADFLISTSQEIVILGTTATVPTSPDKCVNFSLQRANAVKSLFVELGVAESQINCKGLGYDNEFHIPDSDGNGNLNENAPKNRAVLIYRANSEIGKKYTK